MREYSYIRRSPVRALHVEPYRSGTADGVLSWFEAEFGDETVTNSPGTHGHWHQAFHPFDRTFQISLRGVTSACIVEETGIRHRNVEA